MNFSSQLAQADSFLKQNNLKEALELFNELCEKYPNQPEPFNGIGLIYLRLAKYDLAKQVFLKAIQLSDFHPEILNSYASAVRRLKDYKETHKALLIAELLKNRSERSLCNLSALFHVTGRVELADILTNEAYRRNPNFSQARWQKSMQAFRFQDYSTAWGLFKARIEMSPEATGIKSHKFKPWMGEKTNLILRKEQGVGDSIQMLRFLPELQRRTIKVFFDCESSLIPIVKSNFSDVETIDYEKFSPSQTDEYAEVTLFGLGELLEISPINVPNHQYLTMDGMENIAIEQALSKLEGKKIGVVWSGNPLHHNDANRSLSPELFARAVSGVDAHIVLLQLPTMAGSASFFKPKQGYQVVEINQQIKNWQDTAIAISRLDAVVTVDTSVLHMAGALGVPTFALIPGSPDWRWGVSGVKSYWYQQLNMYRQQKVGSWSIELDVLKSDLESYLLDGCMRSPSIDTPQCIKTKIVRGYQDTNFYRDFDKKNLETESRELVSKIRVTPLSADLWEYGAQLFLSHKKYEDAIAYAIGGLTIRASYRLIMILVESYRQLRNYKEAMDVLDLASSIYEIDIEHTYLVKARIKYESGDLLGAVDVFRSQCHKYPNNAKNWSNYAFALKEAGHFKHAVEIYEKAHAMDKNDQSILWNMANLYLLIGDYSKGLTYYESRWDVEEFPSKFPKELTQIKWNGKKLDGTLLVHMEQGYGDAIQFIRYLSSAEQLVKQLVVKVDQSLLKLFVSSMQLLGLDSRKTKFIVDFKDAGMVDAQIPLVSLPFILKKLNLSDPPYSSYYIDGKNSSKLQNNFLKVGLIWRGRDIQPHEKKRNFSLADLQELMKIPGCEFYTFQKDLYPGEKEQINELGLTNMSEGLTSFYETSLRLADMDLVISSDTAMAHLAGAVGIKTWVALCKVPDWRWGTVSASTPWYQSVRLFRQSRYGEWSDVFSAMKDALVSEVKQYYLVN